MTVMQFRENAVFLKTEPRKHGVRTSIQHWQLRDLVACPNEKGEFYFVNQNNVSRYNTASMETTPIIKDLLFSPNSMTAGCGYLAAGGHRSQLAVSQLNSNWFVNISVGGSINNALCISNHLGSTRLLVSNNDQTIKVYLLPSMYKVASISFPTAVNYAAVSPDGTKMVAVGDSNEVFLFDITADGYKNVATYTSTIDAGFSCAWNQSSDKFAVASQDGYVSVWDVRSSNKLAKINATQGTRAKGACRCVKFSPSGSVDLLMFSEHVSYVNIVDARTFNDRQSIRVAPPSFDQHISGFTFSPDSKAVYVGVEGSVLEYEVDTMRRRSFPTGSIL
ncbi:hypothetical protein K7432_005695 [Basidiobolus ranarum]|uniref:DUF2415 domain-containing protein n=1 Tax=Basidiobolus ranarum TaxID=34480 RepID=A0ABR2W317_9FUNG